MKRRLLVGGNWKLNGSKQLLNWFSQRLKELEKVNNSIDILLAPPFVYLDHAVKSLPNHIFVSAQNVFEKPSGAFTGQIGVQMLIDIGCKYVIIGHSECRHIFNEDNLVVASKAKLAVENGLNVLYCVGEKDRGEDVLKSREFVAEQLETLELTNEQWSQTTIAYEPVWAIGTGKSASCTEAEDMHMFIRQWLEKNAGSEVSEKTRILYGGRKLN